MIKPLSVIAITLAFCTAALAEKTKQTGPLRGFEECHQLAVARGVHPKKRPERYDMLNGFQQKTNPTGLIARCMAGKL